MAKPTTLRELKQTEWASPARLRRTVKDEMRDNLVCLLENGSPLFPGIVGYEDTVVPQLVTAVLSRHNFILLGLRGQAKSRILRDLVLLLDEEVPILAGSEVNDDPFHPISKFGRELLAERGDDAPIAWLPRDSRYVEKLATPDVTIADIIGDVDPIKAARGGHLLSDELTMHFGLLPRSNRGVFAINELPDPAGKIQVGLFNIMQEGDVQVKGYPVRLNLDVALVFTANPEDYTARGKIITPLKDRIGSEIVTHYPYTVELGAAITRQEAWLERHGRPLKLPDFVAELIERVAFEAREDKRVDRRSGVSQRLPISVLENVVSNAERRTVTTKEKTVVPRISDIYGAPPARRSSPAWAAPTWTTSSTGSTKAGRSRSPWTSAPRPASRASASSPACSTWWTRWASRPKRTRAPWSRHASWCSRGWWPRSGSRATRSSGARARGAEGAGVRQDRRRRRRSEPLPVSARSPVDVSSRRLPSRSVHGQARRWRRPARHRVFSPPRCGHGAHPAPGPHLQPVALRRLRGRRSRGPVSHRVGHGRDRPGRSRSASRLRLRGPGTAARRHPPRGAVVLDRALLDSRRAVADTRRADRSHRGLVERADGDAR